MSKVTRRPSPCQIGHLWTLGQITGTACNVVLQYFSGELRAKCRVCMAAEQYILCILVAACQTLNDKGLEECRNKTARYGSIVIVFGRRSDDRGLIHERVHYAPDHLENLHLDPAKFLAT
ncbi:hypothetical protein COCSADRAFT_168753 [Bipolaris sorokiniana ND90Pr]|uniref:Uncharacterized protein n=1 Tax=Cochliobolus sativus (strain ND90Pr / ATCC 201652) TaxID=665912 RepID=M2SK65_COCSN|nr:uncharacterized protein COCSADRAFT_168753 [Bipolaris sorokiniana ND90Pr]EMD67568.1 hypothetical protein COCSADRAFT_168753 [Bipolaris sorokiniana ND90Pr]